MKGAQIGVGKKREESRKIRGEKEFSDFVTCEAGAGGGGGPRVPEEKLLFLFTTAAGGVALRA